MARGKPRRCGSCWGWRKPTRGRRRYSAARRPARKPSCGGERCCRWRKCRRRCGCASTSSYFRVITSGYLLKDAPSSMLADAIRRIKAGARVIDPELAAEVWTEADPLTDRERQVLRYAGEGAAGAEIAERLNLSEGTVRNYLSEAISKLGASNAPKRRGLRGRRAGCSRCAGNSALFAVRRAVHGRTVIAPYR